MSSPIADRIRAYVAERVAEVPDYSARQLSLACGWDGSHLSTVLRRLDQGKDVRTATLETIAAQIGRPVAWLLTGEMPAGVRLDSLPAWAALRAETIDRYRVDAAAVDAIGAHRVPSLPRRLDAPTLAQLARAWADAS